MKIISWNCNMAFRKKAAEVIKFRPDILIILECEELEKISFKSWEIIPSDYYWFGKNKNKGIGIFAFNGYKLDLTQIEHNIDFEYIIPFGVRCTQNMVSTIFAVWTQKTIKGHYTWHIYRAMEHYAKYMDDKSIIIGDFNSNSIWDKPLRETNHTHLIDLLTTMNMKSVYHFFSKENQGNESVGTLYFQRKVDRPYHIDYCFISKSKLATINEFRIGKCLNYIAHSDHVPLILDVDLC